MQETWAYLHNLHPQLAPWQSLPSVGWSGWQQELAALPQSQTLEKIFKHKVNIRIMNISLIITWWWFKCNYFDDTEKEKQTS